MDQKHFETIFNSYFPILYLYVNTRINNSHDTDEIVFETLMKLSGYGYQLVNEESIKRFLFMHARHATNQYLRKSNKTIKLLQIYFDSMEIPYEDEQENAHIIRKLYNKIETFPVRLKQVVKLSMQGLKTPEIASKMGVTRNTVFTLKSNAYKFLRKELVNNSNEDPNSTISEINIIKDEINAELIRYIAKHPHIMHDINAHKFEALIAALMKGMGYDVYLTPQTRDGGRDIIAVMNTPSNDKIVTIVQCKRNSTDNIVGIDIVERFIYTIRDKDKANAGWIVTTSTFSRDVRNLQKEYQWLLSLKDNKNLTAWCSNYGQWTKSSSGGLWLPNNPLG